MHSLEHFVTQMCTRIRFALVHCDAEVLADSDALVDALWDADIADSLTR